MEKLTRLSYLLASVLIFASIVEYIGNRAISNAQELIVNQLSDIKPTDWAYIALRSLTECYGCLKGDRTGTYRGEVALTRYEFAAGIQS
jgi:hypothetical protein